MREECLEAQRIVSETYDKADIPAADIQKAREHCEGCQECSQFVSTLAAVRRLPAPQAPRSTVESALAAVREEKATADAARAVDLAAAEAQRASHAADDASPTSIDDATRTSADDASSGGSDTRRGEPGSASRWPKWAVYATWASAAAATLLVAGVVTIQGARFIAGTSASDVGDDGYRLATPGETAAVEESADSFDAATPAPQANVSYVTVGAWVYQLVGSEASPPSNPTTIATTTSSLDSGNAPTTLDVYSIGSASEVLVADGAQYLRFRLVTRTFRGVTYAMKSRSISSFGQWPALPSEFQEPLSDDGEPVFSRNVSDDLAVPVYVLKESGPTAGFAIAPGSGANDPAAGNPNWTWWEQP